MPDLVVIGALALDRPIRLSGPAFPGARLVGRSLDGALGGRLGGGGGNAGAALARAGLSPRVVSVVTDDADGDEVLRLAQAAGLDTSAVVRRPGPGGRTLILIDPAGERIVLALDPTPRDLAAWTLPPPGDGDGLFIRAAYPGAEAWAAQCRGPVILHAPHGPFAGPVDVVTGSADDLGDAGEDPYAAARTRYGPRLKFVVVTHGAAGATAYGPEGAIRVPAPAAQVVDATGAGDIFAAGLLDALAEGAKIEAALRHACAWGAIAVGIDGSAPLEGGFRRFTPGPT